MLPTREGRPTRYLLDTSVGRKPFARFAPFSTNMKVIAFESISQTAHAIPHVKLHLLTSTMPSLSLVDPSTSTVQKQAPSPDSAANEAILHIPFSPQYFTNDRVSSTIPTFMQSQAYTVLDARYSKGFGLGIGSFFQRIRDSLEPSWPLRH